MGHTGGSGISAGDSSRKRHNRIVIRSYFFNCLIVALMAAGLSGIGVLLSDVVDLNTIKRYLQTPWLFVYNALPLVLFMLLLYHLSSRLWFAFFTGGGLFLAVQIANRFKMLLREEPLTLPDFMLGTEAAKVVDFAELPIGRLEISSVLIWLAGSVLLFLFISSRKLRWPVKAAGSIASILLFLCSFQILYKDVKLYDSFQIQGSKYSRVNQFKSRGFVYSFLVRAGTYRSVKPDGYSKEEAERMLEGYRNPSGNMPAGSQGSADRIAFPHVIAVMAEAFYDIDRISGIEFTEGHAPLENFNRIKQQAYHGRIVTDVFGGGTANTEFAFLTGHSLAMMPEMGSPYTSYLRKETFSLTRVFEKAGYATMAFHPGDSWFYNRVNVYDFFGFDRFFFKNALDLKKVKTVNGYISDRDTADFVLDGLKSHIADKPEVPLFEFVVTIENHGPYSKNSLGYPQMIKGRDSIDPAAYNIINNYVNGLSRCDQALGYLADSLEEFAEPVVLLYFADHLPYLGEKYFGYRALGFNIGQSGDLEAYLNHYETPWFIWCNQAARKQLSDRNLSVLTGAAPEISTNFLGVELLRYIGLDGGAYFNFLAELEKMVPVISNRFFKLNGAFTEKLPGETKQTLEQYTRLQYYMLMEKEAVNP